MVAVYLYVLSMMGQMAQAETPDSSKPEIPQETSVAGFKTAVTLTASSLDLDEFCSELSQLSKLKIEAADELKDRKITARFRKRPLNEILQGLDDLFGYHLWYYKSSDRYVIYPGRYAQRLDELKSQSKEDLRSRFDKVQKEYLRNPQIDDPRNILARALARLTQGQVDQLFKEGIYKIPVGQLSSEDQKALHDRFSDFQRPGKFGLPPTPMTDADFQQATLDFRIGGEVDPNLVEGLALKDGHYSLHDVLKPRAEFEDLRRDHAQLSGDFVRDGDKIFPLINGFDEDPAATEIPPKHNTTPGSSDLQRKVRVTFPAARKPEDFTGEYNTPLVPTDDIFQVIAEQAKIDFISDSYFQVQSTLPEDIRDEPLGQALDKLTDTLAYGWERPHSLFLFRSPKWYAQDRTDVSAKKVRPWMKYWHERVTLKKPLELREMAALAYTLSGTELKAFAQVNPMADYISGVSGPFAIYQALTEVQRKEMASDKGILWASLNATQKKVYLDRVGPVIRHQVQQRLDEDPTSAMRITTQNGEIVSAYTNKGIWRSDRGFSTLYPPPQVVGQSESVTPN
jgi:hypothetical protein